VVREPGGTPFAEEVRRLLLEAPHQLTAESEMFLFLAARADLTRRVIRPALQAGRLVVADRYELSTRAYQAGGRGLAAEDVSAAIGLATGGLLPDLYIVLDLPDAVGRERQAAQRKAPDRMEKEEPAFHRRVAEAFLSATGAGIVHLSADRPAAALHEAVWAALADRFPQTFALAAG
jgi:dTMP kinase